MAKKSLIARDKKRSKLVKKYLVVRNKLRDLIKNPNTSYEERVEAQEKLNKQPRNASASRQTTRCFSCGRPRAVYKKFGLCRICLRNNLVLGDIPGGRKASW